MTTIIPGIGHNSGDVDIATRRAQFIEELTKFASARRKEEALTAAQLGALDGLGRLVAQRQSLLDNMAHFYANNKRADPAPAVLLLITFYSDNNDGCCSLSIGRMARFLQREPRRISAAISRLAEENLIHVESIGRGTETSRYYPWVHRSFGGSRDSMTWIMDVRSPLRHAGRPSLRKTQDGPRGDVGPKEDISKCQDGPEGDILIIEENQRLEEMSPRGPSGRTAAVRADVKCEISPRGPSSNTTKDTTDGREEEIQPQLELPNTTQISGTGSFKKNVPPSFIYTPSDQQREKFLTLAAHWTSKGGMAKGVSLHRGTTDELLRDCIASLGSIPPALADRALIGMLTTMDGKRLDAESEEFREVGKFSAFVTYARKVIHSEYKRIASDEMHLRAEAESQQKRVADTRFAQQPRVARDRPRSSGASFTELRRVMTDQEET